MTETGFYRAFEDCHRGSRELIASRLVAYRPFVRALKSAFPDGAGVDLGCGRGEWLELLAAEGLSCQGIDLDDGMLADCRERGLAVEQGDALTWLRAQPDDGLALVSAFHMVEHLPFETLQTLIAEALRVLCPGGLLIMETPNPENLVVGTESFYLDPTHTRPLPAALLSFLARFHGFERVRVLRLQHDPALRDAVVLGLRQVIEGVSPDYSVLAQKHGPQSVTDALGAAFATEDGISRATLVDRYDQLLAERLQSIERGAVGPIGQVFDERVTSVEEALAASVERCEALQTRILALEASVQASVESAASLAVRLEAVYASRSWRITGPLRRLTTLLRRLLGKR